MQHLHDWKTYLQSNTLYYHYRIQHFINGTCLYPNTDKRPAAWIDVTYILILVDRYNISRVLRHELTRYSTQGWMLTEKAGDRSHFNLRIRLALLLLAIVHSRIFDILLRSGIFILKNQEY